MEKLINPVVYSIVRMRRERLAFRQGLAQTTPIQFKTKAERSAYELGRTYRTFLAEAKA